MRMLIVDVQYFGSINYYKKVITSSYVLFEQYERHQKTGFLNRCTIAGANGPITLSVPLEGGRDQKTEVRDIRICNEEDWQKRHWKSIVSTYNRSPWFEYLRDEMADLYKRPFNH